jgi:hypothetical protein
MSTPSGLFSLSLDRNNSPGYVMTGYVMTGYVMTGYVVTGYVVTGYVVTGYAIMRALISVRADDFVQSCRGGACPRKSGHRVMRISPLPVRG